MHFKKEFHIPITNNGITAVDCLAEASGLSKQKIKQYMQKGCVWLEHLKNNESETLISDDFEKKPLTNQAYIQRLRRAKKILTKNDQLHFYYDEVILASEPEEAALIKDLGDYSIWNKPSGMFSQGSKWGDHCTIYRWAEKHLRPERSAFIVHRLDRAAHGLIILAHKKTVASQFSKMFEQRQIEKMYQVIVKGDFTNMIAKAKGSLTLNDDVDDKTAISHVTMLTFNAKENTSTLNVQIETGRKHQIRKHLAGIGFPVVGDRLHGAYDSSSKKMNFDLQLQAKSLRFICPITSEKRVFKLDSQ